ncbi:FadR/GntR family transcriptional regulator [Bacillus massilinigeriensis]|uniref:FadR/GntR family transcriptional regulator n=1 Tax=Bacillus massilionigeriensis TaxID=1805475 RepID=UPI00096B6760|nr:GntR family transcriptional regulator [Bacillus massilionigeriensis]
MSSTKKNSKVYLKIVKQLRDMIELDGLKPGDKLPSERELSERLNVGRSSVREALRALELLGLIETRIGEGTFIRDFRDNQLVQLLSTFILQENQAIKDVKETKYFIEMDCLRLLILRNNDEQIHKLKNWVEIKDFNDDEFFSKIVQLSENHLMQRIWMILKDYYNSLPIEIKRLSKKEYLDLLDAILTRKEEDTILCYRLLRKLSNE